MNRFQDAVAVEDRRASASKLKVKLAAVRAFETRSDCPLERMTTPFAKWRFDEPHLLAAFVANEGLVRRRAGFGANLAYLRVNERQPGVDPGLHGIENSVHPAARILVGALGKGKIFVRLAQILFGPRKRVVSCGPRREMSMQGVNKAVAFEHGT